MPRSKVRLSLNRFSGNSYVNPTYGLVAGQLGHRQTLSAHKVVFFYFVKKAHYLLHAAESFSRS